MYTASDLTTLDTLAKLYGQFGEKCIEQGHTEAAKGAEFRVEQIGRLRRAVEANETNDDVRAFTQDLLDDVRLMKQTDRLNRDSRLFVARLEFGVEMLLRRMSRTVLLGTVFCAGCQIARRATRWVEPPQLI